METKFTSYVAKKIISILPVCTKNQLTFCVLGLFGFSMYPISATADDESYAAVWIKDKKEVVTMIGISPNDYGGYFKDFTNQGYRPFSIDSHVVDNQTLISSLWEINNDNIVWYAYRQMSGEQYQKRFNELLSKGYSLKDVSGYKVNGRVEYAAIWEKSRSSPWVARHGMTSEQYQREFDKHVGNGYRLVSVDGYEAVNGNSNFAAIWRKQSGPAWKARHNMSETVFSDAHLQYLNDGYSLVDLSVYKIKGTELYAGIWRKTNSDVRAMYGMSYKYYQDAIHDYAAEGYSPIDVSGY